MPFFENAKHFNINDGSFNDVTGNMTVHNNSRRVTNNNSNNRTTNNITDSYNDSSVRDYSRHTTSNYVPTAVNAPVYNDRRYMAERRGYNNPVPPSQQTAADIMPMDHRTYRMLKNTLANLPGQIPYDASWGDEDMHEEEDSFELEQELANERGPLRTQAGYNFTPQQQQRHPEQTWQQPPRQHQQSWQQRSPQQPQPSSQGYSQPQEQWPRYRPAAQSATSDTSPQHSGPQSSSQEYLPPQEQWPRHRPAAQSVTSDPLPQDSGSYASGSTLKSKNPFRMGNTPALTTSESQGTQPTPWLLHSAQSEPYGSIQRGDLNMSE